MSVRTFVVTGVPPGAQEAAQRRAVDRRRALVQSGGKDQTMKHRVSGQEVIVFADRGLADACQEEMQSRGLITTLRRWKIR